MRHLLIFSLLFATVSYAQSADNSLKLGDVAVTGTFRSRAYDWDWFEPASGNNQYAYSGNLLRVNFKEQRKGWEWDAELAAPFLLGLPDNATAAAPQGALGLGSNYYSANGNSQYSGMIFPKQLYARFKGLGASEAGTLQVGRFEFNDGSELTPKNPTLATLKRDRVSQRLIGAFGWSDVGRSFDGARFSFSKPTNDFTFVAAVPTRGVFQTDGWGWNRAAFGYGAFTHEWGRGNHAADTRFFILDYDDWRHIVKTDNRSAAARAGDKDNIRIETFGAHSLHAVTTSAGTIDALAWGAVQTGRWGTQTQLAYALDFEGGIQPKVLSRLKPLAQLKPWLRGGFTIGSGDSNPGDGRHGTFFQILPTPRPYARLPFFNMMNIEDRFGALVLRPHAKITLSSEFHALCLSNANDLWYSGGGVFQPWTFGYTGRATSGRRSLGNLYDTSIEYRATRLATFTGYFGHAQGLAAMEQIYPKGTQGNFGYLEAAFKF
jgi:hypothetical protein